MKLLQCVVFHTNLSDNTSPFAIRIKYTLHHGPLNNPESTKSGDTGDPAGNWEHILHLWRQCCVYFYFKKKGELEVLKFMFGNLISRLCRSLVSDVEKIWIWPRRKVVFQYLNTCILFSMSWYGFWGSCNLIRNMCLFKVS